MGYAGDSFAWEEGTDEITDVVMTNDRISLDWKESGKTGHLEASSTDGITYSGHFGYKSLDDFRHVEFIRYIAKDGSMLLMGSWRNSQSGKRGNWLIRLTPSGR